MPPEAASTSPPSQSPPSYRKDSAPPGYFSSATAQPAAPAFLPFPDSAPAAPLPTEDHPLQSYWLATSSSPGPSKAVYGAASADPAEIPPWDEQVDVAIIGSGITGVSAAHHLAQKLPPSIKNVTVLEARDFCSGATGRNGGHLTAASILSYSDLASNPRHLARFLENERTEHWGNDRGAKTDETIRRMLTLEARTVAELLMITRTEAMKAAKSGHPLPEDPELVCGSNWCLCASQAECDALEASIEAAKRAGLSDFALQVRRVPQDELEKRLHHPSGIAAAFEIPGGTVHPRRLVSLLWQRTLSRAKSKGLDLKAWVNTPVTSIEQTSQGALLSTARGHISARYVVHATNAYVSHLLPDQFSGTGNIRSVVPTRGQCIAVRPTKSPQAKEPLWQMGFNLNHGYEYLGQRPSDGLSSTADASPPCILGGGRESAARFEWNVADDSSIDADVSQTLRPMLPNLFPSNFSSGDKVDLEWTGIMGFTSTYDPIVGPVPVGRNGDDDDAAIKGQYVSAGYSGHGMSRAYSCAEIVVDMIVAEERKVKWEAPSWFPLAYLTIPPQEPPQINPHPVSPGPPQQAASRPSITDTAPQTARIEASSKPRLLLAAGSNGAGQLALGLGCTEDAHQWTQCFSLRDKDGALESFPPPGWDLVDIQGGANHTVALLGPQWGNEQSKDSSAAWHRELWITGDTSLGQFGPYGSSDGPFTVFHRIPTDSLANMARDSLHSDRHFYPTHIAASWSNTYVALGTHDQETQDEADFDDALWCLGGESDFGQLGVGRAAGNDINSEQSQCHRIDYRSPIVAYLQNKPKDERNISLSGLTILQVKAGVRHVLAMVVERSARSGSSQRAFLVGWGASRHGQLQLHESSTTKSPKIQWTPRVVRSWAILQPSTNAAKDLSEPILSAGRDHSAILLPPHWTISSAAGTDDAMQKPETERSPQLFVFGSNRAGQLDVVGPVQAGPSQPCWVGTTWNSTMVACKELRSQRFPRIVGSGKDDRGQLGCGGVDEPGRRVEGQRESPAHVAWKLDDPNDRSSFNDTTTVCGSEHTLTLLRAGGGRGGSGGGGRSHAEVWGWGWNEHGNLATGDADADVLGPKRIWPPNSAACAGLTANVAQGRPLKVWAGCATSFVLVEPEE